MRITKDLAENIAIKLTEKKAKEIKVLEGKFYEFLYKCYVKTTPKEVLTAFKLHPEWMLVTTTIRLDGLGFHYESVNIKEKIIPNRNGAAYLKYDVEIFKQIKELQNNLNKSKNELNQLSSEISTALYGLRTFAQVEKHLPEAVPFLPVSSSMEVMVNFDTLRKRILQA